MARPMSSDATQATYGREEMVQFYAAQQELQPAERALFAAHVPPGSRVLDLGVGAGRTTPALAAGARQYLGVDYSAAMVEHCRMAFPTRSFEVGDARELKTLDDESFDVVVFSFNGIDSIPDQVGREACLKEVARVLRPGGVFLFSVHHARYLLYLPVLRGVSPLRRAWRMAYACVHTAWLLLRVFMPAYWRGYGRLRDLGTHGGLPTFVVTPEAEQRELAQCGLSVIEVVPAPDPAVTWPPLVAWYYYACRRA